MEIKDLFEDDDAVSPVIGVILMVAITVILAAVIGTFVLGLGDQVKSSAPSASLEYEYETNASGVKHVNITHTGGDELSNDSVSVTASDGNIQHRAYESDPWTAGDSIIEQSGAKTTFVTGTTAKAKNINWGGYVVGGGTVRVIWSSEDGSKTNVISESEVPSN